MIRTKRKDASRRRGFTLVEFLIASALTLLVLGMAVEGLIGAQRASRAAADEEFVTRIAYSVIDRAKAFGCGEQIIPDTSPQTSGCEQLLPNAGQPVTRTTPTKEDYQGDFTASASLIQGFAATGENSRRLSITVAMSTYRVPTSGLTTSCGSPAGTNGNLVRRSANVTYIDRNGQRQDREVSVLQALSTLPAVSGSSRILNVPAVPATSRPALTLTKTDGTNTGRLLRLMPAGCTAPASVTLEGLTSGSYTASWFILDRDGKYTSTGAPENWTV